MIFKKNKSKFITPNRHILINDAGIGSNRLEIDNHYLNNYNYYNKSSIKLFEFNKKRYLERRLKSDKFNKEKYLPKLLLYSTSYYNYKNNLNTNDDYITVTGEKNKYIKTQFLNDSNNYKDLNLKIKKNRLKKKLKFLGNIIDKIITDKNINNQNINKVTDISDNSCENKKFNSANCEQQNEIKNINNIEYNDLYDKILFNKFKKNKKYNDIKCKVIFGKTLSYDIKKRKLLYDKINKKKKLNIENYINKTNINRNENFKFDLKKNIIPSYSKYIITDMDSDKDKKNYDLKILINNDIDKEKFNKDLNGISMYYKKYKFNGLENRNSEKDLIKNYSHSIK